MKKLLSLIIIGMLAIPVAYADEEIAAPAKPATKQVCKVVKGKKQCKTIKVHRKHEGTKVPKKIKKR
jgi:hypothetical protein